MPRTRLLLICLVPAVALVGSLTWTDPRVYGRVVDDAGRPVAGATVRWQTTRLATTSDADGRFTLPPGPVAGRATAAKEGYFIAGGVPTGHQPFELVLRGLPDDHEDYAWIDPGPERNQPGNCATCHAEPYREWNAGGHARSATGRHFRNLYEGTDWAGRPGVGWGVLTQNEPGAAVCVSCHAPAVRDDDPGALDLRRVTGNALRGVHCDYCHKVEAVAGPLDGLGHGRFNLRLRRPDPAGGEQLFFGPLDDVDRGDDAYSALQRDSRLCAACHEGRVFGVPVYTTYSEWQASPAGRAGRSCQSCHMAPTGQMTNVATGRGGKERDPATLANHRFFAGSQEDMLRGCLSLGGHVRRDGAALTVTAEVVATQVGHRVPTGYIDRQVILAVEARDAAGQPVAALDGPLLPVPAGRLAGKPGRLFAKILSGPDGHAPAPFWWSQGEPADARLWPEKQETFAWRFPVQTKSVKLRLLYRRFWEEVASTKGWPSVETVVRERALLVPDAGPR